VKNVFWASFKRLSCNKGTPINFDNVLVKKFVDHLEYGHLELRLGQQHDTNEVLDLLDERGWLEGCTLVQFPNCESVATELERKIKRHDDLGPRGFSWCNSNAVFIHD